MSLRAIFRKSLVGTSVRTSTLILFVGGAISKLLGFARELAMASIFGTSLDTDTWLMASVFPNLLFSTINTTLVNVAVPILSGLRSDSEERAYINELFTTVVLICGIALVLTEWKTPTLVAVIAPGFHGHKLRLTISLTRIMLPTMVLWGVSGLAQGILQSRGTFVPTTVAPLVVNVIRVGSILSLGSWIGIKGVAVGFVLSIVAQYAYFVSALRHNSIKLRFRWTFSHPLLRETLTLTMPFFYGNAVGTVGLIVDRILASSLHTGSIAALNYAYVLSQVPIGLFATAVVSPLFTQVSVAQNRGYKDNAPVMWKGFAYISGLLVPTCLIFVLFREPIITAVYQHGVFRHGSTSLTSTDFLYWAIGVPGFGWSYYLSKILFARKASRVIFLTSTLRISVNVILDFLLIGPMMGAGLALATSVAAWAESIALGYFILRDVKKL